MFRVLVRACYLVGPPRRIVLCRMAGTNWGSARGAREAGRPAFHWWQGMQHATCSLRPRPQEACSAGRLIAAHPIPPCPSYSHSPGPAASSLSAGNTCRLMSLKADATWKR